MGGGPRSYEDNSRHFPPAESMLTRYSYFQPSGSSGAHFLGGNLTGIILIAPWHPRTPQDNSRQTPLTKNGPQKTQKAENRGIWLAYFLRGEFDGNYPHSSLAPQDPTG